MEINEVEQVHHHHHDETSTEHYEQNLCKAQEDLYTQPSNSSSALHFPSLPTLFHVPCLTIQVRKTLAYGEECHITAAATQEAGVPLLHPELLAGHPCLKDNNNGK